MTNKLVTLFALVVMSVCTAAQSQNLVGFDRGSFGSIVLSQAQSAGSELQLELSIGSYENEPIINYRGTIFAEIGRSVGRLDVLTDKGLFPCTAFIVSKKYILTNYHCSLGLLDNEKIGATRIEATQFVAGYVQTGIDEGTNRYTVVPIPVEFSEKLDYAVLEVIGNPSQDYGELKLASMVPNDRTPFWVIGHPQGKGQHISREKCRASSPAVSKTKLLHTCDTLPGNSGSPVIDAGLQVVVALHHAGIANDSVNAAILMSKILENSKVLAAYRAPNVVPKAEPKPIKTAETTACDALYSEAKEAKACFAYEAYFKSCRDHSLAPIADGYINKFCQVQEVVEAEDTPETPSVNCSSSTPEMCSVELLCIRGTKLIGNSKAWTTGSYKQAYVAEAQKRGLSCGVGAASVPNCSGRNLTYCTNKMLCAVVDLGGRFYDEAKKRGLTCGVNEIKPIKIAFKNESVLRRKQLQYALKKLNYYKSAIDALYGPGTEKALTGYAKAKGININNPERVFKSVLSQVSVPNSFRSAALKPCSAQSPEACTSVVLCNLATGKKNNVPFWIQASNLQRPVKEAKTRGLTCGVK